MQDPNEPSHICMKNSSKKKRRATTAKPSAHQGTSAGKQEILLDEKISEREIGFQIGHPTRQAPSAKRAPTLPRTPAKGQGRGFPRLYTSETEEPSLDFPTWGLAKSAVGMR